MTFQLKFPSHISRVCDSVCSSIDVCPVPPALLTRMSIRSNSAAVRLIRFSISSSFCTSVGTARHRPQVAAWISAARRSSGATVRLAMTTSAPRRLSNSAVAAPMPAEPPVTIATRPLRSNSGGKVLYVCRCAKVFSLLMIFFRGDVSLNCNDAKSCWFRCHSSRSSPEVWQTCSYPGILSGAETRRA